MGPFLINSVWTITLMPILKNSTFVLLVDGGGWGQVQVSESESQVTVLKMNGSGANGGADADDAASLKVVGSATGIGLN